MYFSIQNSHDRKILWVHYSLIRHITESVQNISHISHISQSLNRHVYFIATRKGKARLKHISSETSTWSQDNQQNWDQSAKHRHLVLKQV